MTNGGKFSGFVGTLEGKIFILVILFGIGLFYGLSQNWRTENVQIFQTMTTALVGALVGAYGKGQGVLDNS
jgi:hypothetical protein